MVHDDQVHSNSGEPPQLGDSWWEAALSEGEDNINLAFEQDDSEESPDHVPSLILLAQPENDWNYVNRLYQSDEIIRLKVSILIPLVSKDKTCNPLFSSNVKSNLLNLVFMIDFRLFGISILSIGLVNSHLNVHLAMEEFSTKDLISSCKKNGFPPTFFSIVGIACFNELSI